MIKFGWACPGHRRLFTGCQNERADGLNRCKQLVTFVYPVSLGIPINHVFMRLVGIIGAPECVDRPSSFTPTLTLKQVGFETLSIQTLLSYRHRVSESLILVWLSRTTQHSSSIYSQHRVKAHNAATCMAAERKEVSSTSAFNTSLTPAVKRENGQRALGTDLS